MTLVAVDDPPDQTRDYQEKHHFENGYKLAPLLPLRLRHGETLMLFGRNVLLAERQTTARAAIRRVDPLTAPVADIQPRSPN